MIDSTHMHNGMSGYGLTMVMLTTHCSVPGIFVQQPSLLHQVYSSNNNSICIMSRMNENSSYETQVM